MEKALIIGLSLLLGGCATQFGERISKVASAVQNFTVTQSQINTARNGYDGLVLAPLNRYASLVRCKFNQKFTLNTPCHDKRLLRQIREIDKQVNTAFDDTQNRISSGDNKGAMAAYNTLINAIDVGKALIGQTGISLLGT